MAREDRRSKYRRNTKISPDTGKIDINFDIVTLNLLYSYVTCNNRSIRRSNITNLHNLLNLINMDQYAGDQERLRVVDCIKKGIDARLNHNLTDGDMILHHISGGIACSRENINRELSNHEIDWVNKTVSAIIKDSIIYNDVDRGLALFTKFKATDFADRGPIVAEIEELVKSMQNKFRKAKAEETSEAMFSLTGDNFVNMMQDTYDNATSESNVLRFGCQGLNYLTGGGLHSERVYMILGLPGEGKSTTLLDMAIQIKKYNADYVCKDPTKKPCVVLLVMENSVKESVERLFNMCVGESIGKCANVDEAIKKLKEAGELNVNGNDPVDLIIKYKPNLSVDTSYMYELTEDLEDCGYEVIAFFQDYLKRIRSVEGTFSGELRLQLGATVNEMKTFATLKGIPVVTASQLNREAIKNVDDGRAKNRLDIVSLIGRNNIGESNLILENADWVCVIAPEFDKNDVRNLGMQRIKSRYRIGGDYNCVFLPYIKGTIKFEEDLYDTNPKFKHTLKEMNMDMMEEIKSGRAISFNGEHLASYILANAPDISEENNGKPEPNSPFSVFETNNYLAPASKKMMVVNVDNSKPRPMFKIAC